MHRLAAVLFAATAVAQAPTYAHLVLTRLPGTNPATQLLEVDPTAGTWQPLARFPSDTLPPLAIAIDPYDAATIVAVASTAALSRIVRLDRAGTTFSEHHLGDLTGPVTALAVQQDDVLATVDGALGGLYRLPRRGGAPSLVRAQPNATALQAFGYGGVALVAWTGRPGSPAPDSGVVLVDLATGNPVLGPHTFANPSALELTGAFDLPTAVPRQLLSFADGTFALFAGMIGPPVPVVTNPVIPPGGAVALHALGAYGMAPYAVGGSAYPYLYQVDSWSGAVTVRSVALAGAPVDFASGLDTSAQSLPYAERCGAIVLGAGWNGAPQPGTTFTLTVLGSPNDLVLLAVGLSDFLGGVLPYALPGGCDLEVAPDAVTVHVLAPTGAGSQPIAVPAGPAFLGTTLFAQWLHFALGGVSVSAAAAHRIGT